MRYTPDHKRRTRARIVSAAARLFRRHGYDGVSVDRVMAAAGLTRGGFYGHFESKAALFSEVMRTQHGLTARLRARSGRGRAALRDEARAVTHDYLEPRHRATVVRGCSLASLAGDTVRAGRPAQLACADAVRELATEFARGLESADAPDPRALKAIVAAVGGLLLSSAVAPDSELADAVSAAARATVDEALGYPGDAP